MLTVLSMFLPCTQWVFGPLSPVSPKKISTPTVKVETSEAVLTESPLPLSYPLVSETGKIISGGESMTGVRRNSNGTPDDLPNLEDVPPANDDDVVLVENPDKQPGEVNDPMNRVFNNLDFLVPEIDRMQDDEGRSLVDRLASYGLLQVVHDLAKAKSEGRDLGQTLGTRAQIPTGYMVKTLRAQSTFDSNVPSN